MYHVYILLCSDESYYIGITNNVEKRLWQHNNLSTVKDCYTAKRRPVSLVYVQTFENPLDAIGFEKQIKRWTRAKKEALIRNDINTLKKLSHMGRGHGSSGSP